MRIFYSLKYLILPVSVLVVLLSRKDAENLRAGISVELPGTRLVDRRRKRCSAEDAESDPNPFAAHPAEFAFVGDSLLMV